MNNEELSIIVSSTDSYSDMWPDFFACFKKFWPDCPYKIYLVTNELTPEFRGVEIINCEKDAQWSERMRRALNMIQSKYVCFLLDDFYISGEVDTSLVQKSLKFMDHEHILYYKLMTMSKIPSSEYKSIPYIYEITASLKYGISLCSSIWDRKLFLEKIGNDNYNPWKFEVNRLNEEEKAINSKKIVGVFDNRNILNITHMVVQGKYLPKAVRQMNERGYKIENRKREIMHGNEYFIYKCKIFGTMIQRKIPFLKKLVMPIYIKYSISYRNRN